MHSLSTPITDYQKHAVLRFWGFVCNSSFDPVSGIQSGNYPLQWRHDGLYCISNHQPHHYFLSRLFGRRSKETSKLRVTGLYAGNSPGTGEFPAQMASDVENVSTWWHHHAISILPLTPAPLNSSPTYKNGCHFTDDIFRCIFVNENFVFWLKFNWNLFLRIHLTIQVMATAGDKSLPEPMLTQSANAYMRHSGEKG